MINHKPHKVLGIFSLVMINLVAVDSLRTLPFSAGYGFSIIFYFCLAAIIFLIPAALVAGELATGWPTNGGIYIWVREAFGPKAGLIIIWLQWIYNIVWYPTIISFIAATIAYLFSPALSHNRHYMLICTLSLFWLITLSNFFGMKTSSYISTLGASVGTVLPMLFIILLGIYWFFSGYPLHIHMNTAHLFPHLSSFGQLTYFTAVLFGLIGLEMSAVHASEVKNPSRDYPKALLISTLLILFTLIGASLSIAIILPKNKINIVTGLIGAFISFFNAFHMQWMGPIIVFMIIIGAFAGVSSWVIGPTKGLLVAIQDTPLPAFVKQQNRFGVPSNLLLIQGIIFTLLCSAFEFMPSVSSSYWLLTAMTAQLALLGYIGMFAAAIKLRYKAQHVQRSFNIPGGLVGIWLVAGTGILTCIAAVIIGFIPPTSLHIGSLFRYESILALGIILFVIAPIFILKCR